MLAACCSAGYLMLLAVMVGPAMDDSPKKNTWFHRRHSEFTMIRPERYLNISDILGLTISSSPLNSTALSGWRNGTLGHGYIQHMLRCHFMSTRPAICGCHVSVNCQGRLIHLLRHRSLRVRGFEPRPSTETTTAWSKLRCRQRTLWVHRHFESSSRLATF